MSTQEPVNFWEALYSERGQIWSGRVNQPLLDVVGELGLEPGLALDLGCGEGGDAVWLAEHGWTVTAVDISPTATARGSAAAEERGLDERIDFVATDLTTWTTDATYDLVSASFFQAPVELARTEILRNAAERLAPGGRLVAVSHAGPPSWAKAEHIGDHRFVTPAQEVEALALGSDFAVELAETRGRTATGPDGQEGVLEDSLVVVRRVP